ncbi:MAG: hypothetical protein KCHDKBKB_02162 [Elusimicrobia bacterium]|nr:hypothetical protein [Elusimicrobiota bacterium]
MRMLLTLLTLGAGQIGCKKKSSNNTSSGGGVPVEPAPINPNPTAPQQTLTVTKSGNGTGTVTSNPAGIDCGGDCSENYNYNSVVTLAQAQQTGYFTGWSGACSGDKQCSVTMSEVKNVGAAFENVSVNGDYCQSSAGLIFCFFVRSNAVVQVAMGPNSSNICRLYFYSGNTITNRSFNVDTGTVKFSGDFLSAYRVAGHFNGNCSLLSTNSFDFETTRPTGSVSGASAMSERSMFEAIPYDPEAK